MKQKEDLFDPDRQVQTTFASSALKGGWLPAFRHARQGLKQQSSTMVATMTAYFNELKNSVNTYLEPAVRSSDARTSSSSSSSSSPEKVEQEQEKNRRIDADPTKGMALPGSLDVDGYDHRKPSNSCKKVREDMVACFQNSPCFKQGEPFEACMASYDKKHVGQHCIELRLGYAQCRRDLLNRQRIWQRGNRAA